MKAPAISDNRTVLNRVLNLQRFSLANYLRYARPWAGEADHLLLAVVFGIADAQSQNVNRVGELLIERHATVEPGTFSQRFTGLNDLSIRYVAPGLIDDLEQIIHELRKCRDKLHDDREARDFVQAILRDEQRHLTLLGNELHHVDESNTADYGLVSVASRWPQHDLVDGKRRPTSEVVEGPIPA